MTNDEYLHQIAPKVETLTTLSMEALSLCQGIIGRSLTKEDYYFSASANRCINLITGFVDMLKTRNLTCAGVLLRMQMDNCMRTYAAFIAEDYNSVVDCIIQGGKVSSRKDKNGRKMSDGYLKDEISKIDPVFADVYDQASGYVHLSEKAFYQMVASYHQFPGRPAYYCQAGQGRLQADMGFYHFGFPRFRRTFISAFPLSNPI